MRRLTDFRFAIFNVLLATAAMGFFGHAPVAAGDTVLNMPAPPKIIRSSQPRDLEADVQAPAAVVTWLDKARDADLAGSHRSYLGVVAISRYGKSDYRSSPRYSYYSNPYRYSHSGWYSHGLHYPFDVRFLHGVPIGFPWIGFHWKSSFCW